MSSEWLKWNTELKQFRIYKRSEHPVLFRSMTNSRESKCLCIYRSTVQALHNFVRTHKGNYGIRTPIVVRGFLADGRFVSWSRSVVYMRTLYGGLGIAVGVALGDCDAAVVVVTRPAVGWSLCGGQAKLMNGWSVGSVGASELVRCCCWDVSAAVRFI